MWAQHPADRPQQPTTVAEVLDPVLVPLGFAAGQGPDGPGQVIYCRGFEDSDDGGCIDLVIELAAEPDLRIVEVRYWGFTSDRWQLDFPRDADLTTQLDDLARTLPVTLA